VDGLIGWGALAARARLVDRGISPTPGPNSRPWQHLPDLAALTSQLKKRLGC
jgi:hypothetical protein